MKQEVYFKNIQSKISELLDTAEFDVKIAVAWFTDENLINKVKKLAKAGVNITIIIYDDRINNKDLFKELYHLNCKIYLSKKLMHNKFCVIDDEIVINGSYNWTYSAHSNNENITVTYSNIEFTENFVEEFQKLSNACSLIDGHFKYSKDTLKNLEYDFELFFEIVRLKNKFPYFKKVKDFKTSYIHSRIKIKNGYVLILNEVDEYNFYRYFYFLERDFSILKIEKYSEVNFVPPVIHSTILDFNNIDDILYAQKGVYIIEEKLDHKEYGDFYSINNNGETIVSKTRFAKKFENGFYQIKYNYGKTKIYDKNLNKIEFEGFFKDLIPNIGIISEKYFNGRYKYRLTNFDNKVLVDFIYDYYHIIDDNLIKFQEYPMLYSMYEKYYDKIIINRHSGNYEGGESRIKECYKIHLYDNNKKEIKILDKIENQNETVEYYFKSDSNYFFFELYEEFSNGIITAINFKEIKNNYKNKFRITDDKFEKKRYAKFLKTTHYCAPLISVEEQNRINKKSCYIATMAYEDINHPKVQSFRDFRDNYLSKTVLGNVFIMYYYKHSPSLVKVLEPHKTINKLIRFALDILNYFIPKS